MSKSILCAMCVAFLGASSAHAEFEDRTILLLLKNLPGGPAPVDIVNYANAWPHAANRPLQAFDIKDPEASGFLMEDRATGDFLAWLQANPNSARSKLEDSVLILFSSPDDIPEALAALQADPYVDTASLPLDLSFHTAAATDVGIDTASQALGTQYGWDDMDLAAAWQITGGGYAQIAHVDMGVAANHPALRAFAGNSYVGGNLMLIASKDVGLTGQPAQPGFREDDVDEGKAMFIPASLALQSMPLCRQIVSVTVRMLQAYSVPMKAAEWVCEELANTVELLNTVASICNASPVRLLLSLRN